MSRNYRAVLATALLGIAASAAGAPRLKTIDIDGDLADWTEIVVNSAQTSLDADGSHYADCALSRDRDCGVQGSGRDLRLLAWTYDADHLYLSVMREGSASNTDAFWLYLDLDGNGRLGRRDVVLRVLHHGANRATDEDVFEYLPQSVGGDSMTDASTGLADGYQPPGLLGSRSLWSESLVGGSDDGRGFEARVPWSVLGVMPGSAMSFHATSANTANPRSLPGQGDDNMGSIDSGTSLAYVVAVLDGDSRRSVAPGSAATHRVSLANEGIIAGPIRLDVTGSLALETWISIDRDEDGRVEDIIAIDSDANGSFADNGDSISAGWDRDGDGYPEIPDVRPGESVGVVVQVRTRQGQASRVDETVLTATPASGRDAGSATLTTGIGDVVVAWNQTLHAVAGTSVPFAFSACNNGSRAAIDIRLRSSVPLPLRLTRSLDCDDVPMSVLAEDRDGDGRWDRVMGGDTTNDGVPDTGPLPMGACGCMVGIVDIPANAPDGPLGSVYVTGSGPGSSEMRVDVEVGAAVSLTPAYRVADDTAIYAGSGRSVFFTHELRNRLASDMAFDLDVVNSMGWRVSAWSDPDGDGNISDGAILTRTPVLRHEGGALSVVIEVSVPPTAAWDTLASTSVIARAVAAPQVIAESTDEVIVSRIATHADPLYMLPTTRFAPCDAVYTRTMGLEHGQPDRFSLRYLGPMGDARRLVEPLVADPSGIALDEQQLASGDPAGTWQLKLRNERDELATHRMRLEADGHVASIVTTPALLGSGTTDVTFDVRLSNDNLVASFDDTRMELVAVAPDGASYIAADGSIQPYTGSESTVVVLHIDVRPGAPMTVTRTIRDVTAAQQGAWPVSVRWSAACGFLLTDATDQVIVGSMVEECANGLDDDGDGLVDCADPECAANTACIELACSNGVDDDRDGLADCADIDCEHAIECNPEIACGNGLDDDGDGAIDCDDLDCLGSPSCADDDLDDDGVPNGEDCAPDDPSAWAPPWEPFLYVGESGVTAMLAWDDETSAVGPGVAYDVATGGILGLRLDGSFASAECFERSRDATAMDARRAQGSDGFWYLVRAANECGVTPWGDTSLNGRGGLHVECP